MEVITLDGGLSTALEELGADLSSSLWTARLLIDSPGTIAAAHRAYFAAGARVERALEILGAEIPDHLSQAGRLRLEHKQASLEELGQLSEPVLTKDAIAGRIRRLLATADKMASELGIPNSEANLSAEMLEDAD